MQASQVDKDSMFSLINKWQSLGISQKVFCEEHKIRYHVFHYWYKRFKKRNLYLEHIVTEMVLEPK